MLSKKYRLPINLFPRDAGTAFQDRYITIKTVPNGLHSNRLGVLVGKHVSKSAVQRNKLRRTFFDSFRLSSGFSEKRSNPQDLLIVLKPTIMKLARRDLKAKLEKYVLLV
ncbi:MAG: ribonuclease P protein component [Candidatus Colwellbacteria bacterium]|nr:ribonuclease P protein component [Candidatus Colwellbacteria bacterium]